MDLEHQLRERLRAQDPGPDFAAGVIARLETPLAAQRPRASSWRIPVALAATLVAVAFGLHWHLERQRVSDAQAQLTLALQITSYELNEIQRRLARTDTQENGS